MKATRLIAAFLLVAGMVLLSSVAFSQVESPDNIKPGTLKFSDASYALTPAAQGTLGILAGQMSGNPSYKVVITGSAGGSKPLQQYSWERVNTVIEYMSEHYNIDRGRFIFRYPGSVINTVTFRVAEEGEEGPSNVPAPYPELLR